MYWIKSKFRSYLLSILIDPLRLIYFLVLIGLIDVIHFFLGRVGLQSIGLGL